MNYYRHINKLIASSPPYIKETNLHLIQSSLRLGYVPKEWKAAKITMIHKPGKPEHDLTSYRPISLLVFLAKLLEKVINRKITDWEESGALSDALMLFCTTTKKNSH